MSTIQSLLRERYGAAAAALPEWNNAEFAALLQHRSVRAFLPEKPAPGVIESLVAAAQSASSSSNLQTWSVVAVEDEARKSRLAALAANQKQILEAPVLLVWLADLSRLRRIADDRGARVTGLDFIEALLLGVIDASLAAQNAAVAAESFGLGIGYIGAIRNYPEKVAAELGLPLHVFPVFGMVVGRPDPARAAGIKPRLPQSVVLHRETYSTTSEADAIDAYDRSLAAYYRSQNLPEQAWSEQALIRVKGQESLGSRKHLLEELTKLGFKLG